MAERLKQPQQKAPPSLMGCIASDVASGGGDCRLDWFRWLLVACQLVTILVTWELWDVREYPPNLPANWNFLPPIDMSLPLVGSLVLVLITPRWGVALHVILLVAAMCLDQARMQPQIVSCGILMLATLPNRQWQLFGCTHVFALWFYAGLHKLISPGYFTESTIIPNLLKRLVYGETAPDETLVFTLHLVAAVVEMSLAVLILFRRTRKPSCVLAAAFHAMILIGLLAKGWNVSVWAWNIAVVAAAFALIWPWADNTLDEIKSSRPALRIAAFVILISPLGYYAEWTDAYLAHCLYSHNKPSAFVVKSQYTTASRPSAPFSMRGAFRTELNASLPPEHRLFEAWFSQSDRFQPGDYLYIHDPRWGAKYRGRDKRWFLMNSERQLIKWSNPLPKR